MSEKDLELEKVIKDIHDELLTIPYAKELLLTWHKSEEVKLLENLIKDFKSRFDVELSGEDGEYMINTKVIQSEIDRIRNEK